MLTDEDINNHQNIQNIHDPDLVQIVTDEGEN